MKSLGAIRILLILSLMGSWRRTSGTVVHIRRGDEPQKTQKPCGKRKKPFLRGKNSNDASLSALLRHELSYGNYVSKNSLNCITYKILKLSHVVGPMLVMSSFLLRQKLER